MDYVCIMKVWGGLLVVWGGLVLVWGGFLVRGLMLGGRDGKYVVSGGDDMCTLVFAL